MYMIVRAQSLIFLSFTLLLGCTHSKSPEQTVSKSSYSNPILPGFYPDPSICKAHGYFYMTHSTFQFFPGCPLFRSKDLIHWEQIGSILQDKSQLALDTVFSSGGIFAPTLRFWNDTFYLITTNIGTEPGGTFYVTAKNPEGPWSKPIYVGVEGYDPDLFFDDTGQVYVTYSNGIAILQVQIDIETGKIITEPVQIWEGTGGRFPEGPHVYKKDGLYYLLISEGGTEYGHYVVIARSKFLQGPYESCPSNPILTHRDRGNHSIQATGHADFIQADNGSWWTVFLAFRQVGWSFHHLGRETFLAPVSWNSDGWPVIYENGEVEYEMRAELLPQYSFQKSYGFTDFSDTLGHEWMYLRNPDLSNFRVYDNALHITGNSYSLDDVQSPAFVGIRQRQFDITAETKVTLSGQEAGLTLYMDEEHHYELGLRKNGEVYNLFSRATIGSLSNDLRAIEIRDNSVQLYISSDKDFYYFNAVLETDTVSLGKMECRYLSSEVAGGFTGVILGMYVHGNQSEATFDYFYYSEHSEKTQSFLIFESDE